MINNWPTKKLGEVADFQKGKMMPNSTTNTEESSPYILIDDLRSRSYSHFTQSNFGTACLPTDSLLVWDGANAGTIGGNLQGFVGSTISKVSPSQEINPEFLNLILSSKSAEFNKQVHGAAIPHLNKDFVYSLPIITPPLSIQKKIVERLDAIRKAQKLCDTQIQKTEELFGSTLQEIEAIKGDSVKISDICLVKGGKRIPKGLTFSNQQTGHPYLRVTDFKDNSIDIDNLKYVDDTVFQKISNYIISKDDVYISIAGTTGLVGLIPDGLDKANLTENAAKLVIKDINKISKEYLMFCLLIPSNQSSFTAQTHNTSVQKLALFRIQNVEIKLPSIIDQKNIVNKLNNVQEYKKLLLKQKSLLKELFDSVLYKSMNGEMDQ